MKKRMIALAAALMLTATIGTVTAAAYGRGNHGGNGTGNRAAVCYQDTDGDGVCDNRGANGCGGNFVDEDGDGICDNCGGQHGTGRHAGGHHRNCQ